MDFIITYFAALWALTVEMSPYLLLGFLFAGILKVYFPQQKLIKYMGGRNFRSVLNGSLLGIPLPLCSCGVIPTGVSFHKNGASKGSTLSFLISTPQTGVDSILATYALLGLPFALIRPVVALLTGLAGGVLANKLDGAAAAADADIPVQNEKYDNKFVAMLKYAFVDFMQDIMKWLVIGLFLAAAIAVAVPDSFFTDYVGNGYVGMLVMLVAAVPMYVCATASVPIAAVLLMKGLAPGAVLVFLMAGPATNAATITVLSNALGRKTFWVYLATIVGGAFLFGTLINEFAPASWFMLPNAMAEHGHEHHFLPEWMGILLAGLLVAFIANGFYQKYFSKQEPVEVMANSVEISVAGMECKHCKANVELNLKKIEGIKTVVADIKAETVQIEGDVDLKVVQETVDGLGYKYGGPVLNL